MTEILRPRLHDVRRMLAWHDMGMGFYSSQLHDVGMISCRFGMTMAVKLHMIVLLWACTRILKKVPKPNHNMKSNSKQGANHHKLTVHQKQPAKKDTKKQKITNATKENNQDHWRQGQGFCLIGFDWQSIKIKYNVVCGLQESGRALLAAKYPPFEYILALRRKRHEIMSIPCPHGLLHDVVIMSSWTHTGMAIAMALIWINTFPCWHATDIV